jgi:hypothetical protein
MMQVMMKAFKSVNSLVSVSVLEACYSENSSLLCPFPAKPRQIPSRLAVSPIEPVGLNLTCYVTSHVTSSEMTVAAVISDNLFFRTLNPKVLSRYYSVKEGYYYARGLGY